jgi:ribose/xylose/arabinose/galactoside ABC-type transport system permease subunit
VLLLLIAAVYLGGTSLLPGQPRYLVVILPWVGLVVASVLHRGFMGNEAADR